MISFWKEKSFFWCVAFPLYPLSRYFHTDSEASLTFSRVIVSGRSICNLLPTRDFSELVWMHSSLLRKFVARLGQWILFSETIFHRQPLAGTYSLLGSWLNYFVFESVTLSFSVSRVLIVVARFFSQFVVVATAKKLIPAWFSPSFFLAGHFFVRGNIPSAEHRYPTYMEDR